MNYESWGRYPRAKQKVNPLNWRDETPPFFDINGSVLPYGQGRSYGDVCLNDGGTLLPTGWLSRFISFDREKGILRCESGVTFAEIYRLIIPQGWFLPVTPGTKYISVGGAIANDIHGKNHHVSGTFGCHVRRFELMRSDGERFICSPTENANWFNATIGGLGLTGIILWAEIQLKPVPSPFINSVSVKFKNLDEFFELNDKLNRDYEYTVAWVDCLSKGAKLGRGHFIVGNHAPAPLHSRIPQPSERVLNFPLNAPNFVLNSLTLKMFNALYYHRQRKKVAQKTIYFEPFFHPLDSIGHWNRIYGKRGFFQYQFVLPYGDGYDEIKEVFKIITASGMGSFLAVMKTFGTIPSPGMLSFPAEGFTLALDFPNQGIRAHELFRKIDEVIFSNGGRVYPAKDARMPAKHFQQSYPRWQEFTDYVDPQFSSGFWRRVSANHE